MATPDNGVTPGDGAEAYARMVQMRCLTLAHPYASPQP